VNGTMIPPMMTISGEWRKFAQPRSHPQCARAHGAYETAALFHASVGAG